MVTLSLKRLITKVTREINPCHKPIQKPATSVANFSKGSLSSEIDTARKEDKKAIKLKLITEEKIKDSLIQEINVSTNADSIKMGMFYLSDRDIIKSLITASKYIQSGGYKKELTLKLVEEFNIDLKNSYAYGDNQSDIPLLNLVGNPVAVEPTSKLEKFALRNNWTILNHN